MGPARPQAAPARGQPAPIFPGHFTVSRPTAARAGESTAAEISIRAIKKTKRFGKKFAEKKSWHSRVHFLERQILGLGTSRLIVRSTPASRKVRRFAHEALISAV